MCLNPALGKRYNEGCAPAIHSLKAIVKKLIWYKAVHQYKAVHNLLCGRRLYRGFPPPVLLTAVEITIVMGAFSVGNAYFAAATIFLFLRLMFFIHIIS